MTSKQHRLFDDDAPWEDDARRECRVAAVVLPAGPGATYDYRVPERLLDRVETGRRLRVPLGRANRLTTVYCVNVETVERPARRLKPVHSVVDEESLLSPQMIQLARWIAERYLCPLGQVLDTIVPAAVRDAAGTRETTVFRIADVAVADPAMLKLPAKQRRVFEQLFESAEPLTARQLAAQAGCSLTPVHTVRDKGIIDPARAPARTSDFRLTYAPHETDLVLNPDQQQALAAINGAIDGGHHETILLHGVTGSGKTEVYIQAIRHVQSFGRQALVIVPEISLTPQTRRRFLARFEHVAVLHSHLSDAERHHHWRRIASEGVPLVLGSATPSLESWYRASQGQARLVSLPCRVNGRPLPQVRPIDLRDHVRTMGSGALSRPLVLAMRQALEDGGQVILLLNRRGFATHIQCNACGTAVTCPSCDIALTLHRRENTARCHYCDYEIAAPTACPECQAPGLLFRGRGTQRLEAEVRARFPDEPCLRMDTDSMQAVGSHDRAFEAFRRGEVRILLGTQMIAKGLDFPDVTLVGVINADVALHLPDFRAAERTFQLLAQVAGRTGRGDRGGHVLVQTFSPDHPAILAAMRHDFAQFLASELPAREAYGYPPFGSMIRLLVQAENAVRAEQFAESVAAALRAGAPSEIRILGPAPAPMPRLRDLHRFHVQAQSADAERLREHVAAAVETQTVPDDVRLTVDVDPISML